MATVTPVAIGGSVSAADMNRLWFELDRKTSIMFDNKTFLLLGNFDRRFVGLPFFFNGGGTNWAAQLGLDGALVNYDHSIFTRNVEDLAEISVDEEKKIVVVGSPSADDYAAIGVDPTRTEFFNHSLEAHTREVVLGEMELSIEDFWVKEQFSAFAEKVHTFAVAELIFINQVGTFDFKEAWDKFNFFRIHNLSNVGIQIAFENSGYALIVPPWGCRTIRRTGPTGTYESWKYFWPTHGGDDRFWTQSRGESFGSNGNSQLLTTLRANNVTNTTLLFDWINNWDYKVNFEITGFSSLHVGWYKDLHTAAHDIGPVPTYAPIAPATIIGDLLHQHGLIVYTLDNAAAPVEYHGYATIVDDFAAVSVAVTEVAGNLVLTGVGTGSSEKLISVECNLFATGLAGVYSLNHIVDLMGGPFTLDNRMPDTVVAPIEGYNTTFHWDVTAADLTFGLDMPYRAAQFLAKDGLNPVKIWSDPVSKVLEVDWLGNNSLAPANQNTTAAVFANRRLQWTMFGLVLLCEQQLQLADGFQLPTQPYGAVLDTSTILTHPIDPLTILDSTAGIKIRHKISIPFDTWGWGTSVNPFCLAPMLGRSYSNLKVVEGTSNSIHPELFNDQETVDGADFDVTKVDQTETEITAITPIELVPTVGGYFPVWKEPDNLREAVAVIASGVNIDTIHVAEPFGWCPRLPMEFWHFNTIAAWVDAIVRIVPIDYTFAPDLTNIRPGNAGIEGGAMPIEAYALFGEGSDLGTRCGELGIPILSSDDYPSQYQTIKSSVRKKVFGGFAYTDTVIDRQNLGSVGGGMFRAAYTMQRAFGTMTFTPDADEVLDDWFLQNIGAKLPGGGGLQYRWIKIEDVRAMVELRGWKFFYRECWIPVNLELIGISAPAQLYAAPFVDTFTVSQNEFDSGPHEGFYNPNGLVINGGLSSSIVGPGDPYWYWNNVPTFVQRAASDAQWKIPSEIRISTPILTGDGLVGQLNDNGSLIPNNILIGATGYSAATPGFVQFTVDDAYRTAPVPPDFDVNGPDFSRNRMYFGNPIQNLIIQKNVSEPYSQLEQAVTIPITYIVPITDFWSASSNEHATNKVGPESVPHLAHAAVGSPDIQPVFNGSEHGAITVFENTAGGSAFEIVETIHPNVIIP